MTDTRTRTRTPPAEPGGNQVTHVDEGFIMVTRTSYGSEVTESERVRVPDFAGQLKGAQPARVRVAGGVSKNLGDFNHARVDISIELPCLPEMSEIERVVGLISAKLDRMIPDELDKAVGGDG